MTGVSPFVDKPVKASWLARLGAQEDLNFLLTNRIPRMAATRLMGRISRIRSRRFTAAAIWLWRRFTDLDLSEAQASQFESIHDCFTRALKPGSRPIDQSPGTWCSPSDALLGASGVIEDGVVLQAKGMPYSLAELVGPTVDLAPFEQGHYTTLRLTSAMYHRFHAPCDLRLEHVTYISGDTWNVNPIALARVERLFCRNERAVLRARAADGTPLLIIPVAAVLVASLRLHAVDVRLHLRYRGPNEIPVDARYARGQEMGWFEHGSTIIVVTPKGFAPLDSRRMGEELRMGEVLWRHAAPIANSCTESAQSLKYPSNMGHSMANRMNCFPTSKDPIEELRSLFLSKGAMQYGEAVTQLQHALQCGARAQAEGAAEPLVLAAVLHDVGHMLHRDAASAVEQGDDDRHEILGAKWLARWFGPEVTEPIRLHVQAKRFLCARDPHYHAQLSALSKRTLELQGGPMCAQEAEAFECLPFALDAVALRRWDDGGKLEGVHTPDLDAFLCLVPRLSQT